MNLLFLRTKLAVALGAILLFAFVSTSYTNYMVTKRSLRHSALNETLPLIGDSVYSEIQSLLIEPVHASSLMANDTFLKDWVLAGEVDVDQVLRYLRAIRDKYGYYSTFLVSDKTLNYYHYDGVLKQISRQNDLDRWFYTFKETDRNDMLDVDSDEATNGTLTVFINHRLKGYGNEFLGATGIGLKIEDLSRTIASFQNLFGRSIYLVNSNGDVEIHSDESLVKTANILDEEWFGASGKIILSNKKNPKSFEIHHGEDGCYVTTRYFPDFEWFLVVEQDESKGLAAARKALLYNIAVGLAATAFVLMIILWIVNKFHHRLELLAKKDGLTELYNRRYFLELAERELALAQRYQYPVSLLLADVDHFKHINDTYGHESGDAVLRALAEVLKSTVREVDVTGRIGGEEFVMLLPRTDAESALSTAERVRETVQAMALSSNGTAIRMGVSIGMAVSSSGEMDIAELMRRADQAMYQAKENGRNQVRAYEPVPGDSIP